MHDVEKPPVICLPPRLQRPAFDGLRPMTFGFLAAEQKQQAEDRKIEQMVLDAIESSAAEREQMISHPSWVVRMVLARYVPDEAKEALVADESEFVRRAVAVFGTDAQREKLLDDPSKLVTDAIARWGNEEHATVALKKMTRRQLKTLCWYSKPACRYALEHETNQKTLKNAKWSIENTLFTEAEVSERRMMVINELDVAIEWFGREKFDEIIQRIRDEGFEKDINCPENQYQEEPYGEKRRGMVAGLVLDVLSEEDRSKLASYVSPESSGDWLDVFEDENAYSEIFLRSDHPLGREHIAAFGTSAWRWKVLDDWEDRVRTTLCDPQCRHGRGAVIYVAMLKDRCAYVRAAGAMAGLERNAIMTAVQDECPATRAYVDRRLEERRDREAWIARGGTTTGWYKMIGDCDRAKRELVEEWGKATSNKVWRGGMYDF